MSSLLSWLENSGPMLPLRPPFRQSFKTNQTESNQEITKVPNEKLCWTRYKWAAKSEASNDVTIIGQIGLDHYPTRNELIRLALERAAMYAVQDDEPWDPFNCTIVIMRHREPFSGELMS